MKQHFLTCEVSLNTVSVNSSNLVSEIEQHLHYAWFKDNIPISIDSRILHLRSYSEPVQQSASSAIRQGIYRCGVNVEGNSEISYSSQNIYYFFTDVRTYLISLEAELKSVLDVEFSNENFPILRDVLNNFMADAIKGMGISQSEEIEWDYKRSWKYNGKAVVQLALYVKNKSLYENEFYLNLKSILEKKLLSFFINENVSLEIRRADMCIEKELSSDDTSANATLLWARTQITKSAVSELLCLNDWRLVKRECMTDYIQGAAWSNFSVSQCTKYQSNQDKDLLHKCPDGFNFLIKNLCYIIHNEMKSFEEAKEICFQKSSFLVDLFLLSTKTSLFSEILETGVVYWISNRRAVVDDDKEKWLENKFTINKRNQTHFCASMESEDKLFIQPGKCDFRERHPFICIHQPFLLLNSFIFSKPWYKYSHKHSSYYFDHSEKTWQRANKSCRTFPATSQLLQSIRNLKEYRLFKVLFTQMYDGMGSKYKKNFWWMNLFQNGDSLKWLTFPEEEPTFFDWERHTNFFMNLSAGVLTMVEDKIQWTLHGLTAKHSSICEMQDFQNSHSTIVYVEDRRNAQHNEETKDAHEVDLQCVPSGWFVWKSMIWFKDGSAIYANNSQPRFYLSLKSSFTLENISEFQGYYYCSVVVENSTQPIFSPKVLITFPGLYTFVLRMKTNIPKHSNCLDMKSVEFPFIEEFNKFFEVHNINASKLFLKEVTCTESVINSYYHIYVSKDKGTEKKLLSSLERSMKAENSILYESMKKFKINKDDFMLKSTVSCPKETSNYEGHTLTWPETPIGQNALPDEMCITEEGIALERNCVGDFYTGAHWSIVKNECANAQSKITEQLFNLTKIHISKENILSSTESMEILTSSSKDLSPSDVQFAVKVLKNIGSVPVVEPEVLTSVVHTVDNLIETIATSENTEIFSFIPSKINMALGNIALNAQTNNQAIKVAGNNISVAVVPLTLLPRGGVLENWGSSVKMLFNDSEKDPVERLKQFESFEAAVLLPENIISQKQNYNSSNMAFVVRQNIQFLKNIKVISPVIDVILGTEPIYDIDPPIAMVFSVQEMNSTENFIEGRCASWDETLNNSLGGWSYKGCISILIDATHVRCHCNHLTSFAVILEMAPEYKTPEGHAVVLSTLTYIGCSLSIFGLGSVILTFAVFKKWRDDMRHKLLFNLSLSLATFLIIFLIGIKKTEWIHREGCMVVSVLLHYFMLASFSWMLVEAFFQYLCLVKVIGTYIPYLLQKAMSFAWGMPFIIIGSLLCVNKDLYYSTTEFCWLTGDVFYYAIALPVLILLSINFIIFGCIFYSVACQRSTKRLRTNQNERKEMLTRAKAMFCVSVLLGLSWLFGFFAALEGTKLFFQYLFVSTTTLQGLLFSIFFVFRQKKTRDLWRNLVRTAPTSSSYQSTELRHFIRG